MSAQAFTNTYLAPQTAAATMRGDIALVKAHRENFPVASLLLPKRARHAILSFYRFARLADNIADAPSLSAEDKTTALTTWRDSLANGKPGSLPETVRDYGQLVENGQCSGAHGIALLDAFLQDAVQTRYPDEAALLDYCQHSAAPVGRTVLELCGEAAADIPASDSLCNGLQLLNHLQDCQEDYQQLNRAYLPLDWLEQAGAELAMLNAPHTPAPLQAVFLRWLDCTDRLLEHAIALPASIRSRRLRMEVCIILELARHLSRTLRQKDVLTSKVRLNRWQKLAALRCAIQRYRRTR